MQRATVGVGLLVAAIGLTGCAVESKASLPTQDPVGYSVCQLLAEVVATLPASPTTRQQLSVQDLADLAGKASTFSIQAAGRELLRQQSENWAAAEGDLYDACGAEGVVMPTRAPL